MKGFDLSGRVALVTGGSKGIGRAIALSFLDAGADVAIASRSQQSLDAALEWFEDQRKIAAGGKVMAYVANAGEEDQASACVGEVMTDFGRIDVLVNNAATNPYFGPLIDLDLSRAEKTVRVNQYAPVYWTGLTWRAWMSKHGGSVINVASVGGLVVDAGVGYYNATKAALIHLTRHLAAELAPSVRVNAIAPGIVRTEMARALWEPREAEFRRGLPLGRLGEPGDIAGAALFLATDASSWMTGQMIVIDGGTSIIPADHIVHGWKQA